MTTIPTRRTSARHPPIRARSAAQFWGFDIGTTQDEITLRWDGPPAVADFLDRLHAYFLGDGPITAVAGLL